MTRISRERLRLFARHLRQLHRPLLQEADLAVCFMLALKEAGDLDVEEADHHFSADFRKFRDALLEFGGLDSFREGERTLGYLAGVTGLPDAEEAVCSLDPFCYVSHLSAMAWHGLTDRIPKTLFITRPSSDHWRRLSNTRLEQQLGDLFPLYQEARLPVYRRLELHRIRKRPLNIWSSRRLDNAYQAAFKKAEQGTIRVATVGRCFLDMVREPDLCGGIYHVIEVFEEHGAKSAAQILSELDSHGNKLEQARVGYLLEQAEPKLADNPIIGKWAAQVTRGGSRKLDPSEDYADTYSERWALSINV